MARAISSKSISITGGGVGLRNFMKTPGRIMDYAKATPLKGAPDPFKLRVIKVKGR